MSRLSRWTILLGVASALPAVASVLAQDKKAAVAPANAPKTSKDFFKANNGQIQDAKVAKNYVEAAAAKPAAKREDIIAKAVRAIENAVAVRPIAAPRIIIARPAMRIALDVAADPDLDPMAAQWLAQFMPMVRTEIHFLLTVSQATPEQRKRIGGGSTKAAKSASKLYSQSQQRVGHRFQNNTTYPQPRNLVQESVIALAEPVLSAEQIERYKVEIKKREEDHKSLAIKNIIARMDQDLVLSAEQREKLDGVFTKNWNASWCQSIDTFMYADQLFPAIPDSLIVPILNPKQANVWQGTQKNNGMVFGGFGIFNNGLVIDDDFPADEQPKKDAIKAVPAEGVANMKTVIIIDTAKVVVEPDKPKAKAAEKPKDAPKENAAEKPKDTPKPKS